MSSLLKAAADAAAVDTATATATVAQAETQAVSADVKAADVAATAVQLHNAKQALAVAKNVNLRVIDDLKDALPVDFDTLARVQAKLGVFRDVEAEKSLGESIHLQLLSWQDSWVVGPNDIKAPKELVKYSDDGVIAKDGTNMVDWLEKLKAEGHTKAKLSHRCVVVGALLSAEKDSALVGQLIQIDMSPKSRSMFLRYKGTAMWNMQTGKATADSVKTLKLTAVPAKGPDNTDYTKINFEIGTAP